MRVLALILLQALAASLGAGSDQGSPSGKWQGSQNIAGNESIQTCTFTVTGTQLGGTCAAEQGELKVTGKVEGTKVTWSYKTEYNGSLLTVKYAGNIDPKRKITGTVLVEEYSVEGEFTATQAQ